MALSAESPPYPNPDKLEIMKLIQLEALGIIRRNQVSTTEFKENKAAYVPSSRLEHRRLYDGSKIPLKTKNNIDSWNCDSDHLGPSCPHADCCFSRMDIPGK